MFYNVKQSRLDNWAGEESSDPIKQMREVEGWQTPWVKNKQGKSCIPYAGSPKAPGKD